MVVHEERRHEAGGIARLVGTGHKIALFTLPVVIACVAADVARPELFDVGGPPAAWAAVSAVLLGAGLVVWAWSVALILRDVPRHRLITGGPYALVRHPLYTGVAFLVLPWAGLLLNTWLGAVLGAALYAGSRRFVPEEEAALSREFGEEWQRYRRSVRLPWL